MPTDSPDPRPSRPARAPRRGPSLTTVRFRRAIALMFMTLVLPGSAQLVAGRKGVGRVALRIWFAVVAAFVVFVVAGLLDHEVIFWAVTTGWALSLFRIVLMVLAVAWAYLFVDAWRIGEPLALAQRQRLAMVGLNGVLCFSVAGSLLFASHLVGVQAGFMAKVFHSTKVSNAAAGRYNVLLLGGDSGKGRWGMRTDSMTLASINAQTGKTVLFGLPRNMLNFPFVKGSIMAQQFPHGYNCGTSCELNSLVTWSANHKSLFRHLPDPGLEATKEAIEGITGLRVNYFAYVNLMGFRRLVEAVGGVTLDVRQAIPIGGIGSPISGYIKPGVRRLNGFQTLWFARSRVAADDYSRMARQKCVMNAMLHQLSPQTVLLKFDKIARAGESMVSTDIPASQVDTFMQLALKARSQPIQTVSFVPPLINTGQPNIALIHSMVKHAIGVSDGTVKPARGHHHHKRGAVTNVTVGGSIGDMSGGYAANQATNLSNAC